MVFSSRGSENHRQHGETDSRRQLDGLYHHGVSDRSGDSDRVAEKITE